ncbi:MAG: rRNA adenine dimethyltransferase family protein [Phycisphaerales bacterium]
MVSPGTGALSERLLEAGVRVLAVEIDHDIQPILLERLAPFADRFNYTSATSSKANTSSNPVFGFLTLSPIPETRYPIPDHFKLIANLPYNIASPLLVNLAVDHPGMTTAVIMIQREVADRITAKPGGKDYGPLSVILQAVCEVDIVGTLSPACFWPAPKVASAVVRLVRRANPLTDNPAALSRCLQTLFQKRRKQIGAILGREKPLPDGINPDARPESLSVEQFVALARWLG